MAMFTTIAVKLINPEFKFSQGGAAKRLVSNALDKLEKKTGSLSRERVVDYVVCSAYPFKDRGTEWTVNQVFGPKSIERFDTDKGRVYYENRWLRQGGLSRGSLVMMIVDKSQHPQAKYIYMPMEERTKLRMINSEAGYAICQISTLGWSPLSDACQKCKYQSACQKETEKKYPELYRLRMENGIKK